MKQILFFDIDGTLMNNKDHSFSLSTISCLKQLKENGHIVCIATGRGYDSLIKTNVQNLIEWDAIICNNGQVIYNQQHDILFQSLFERKTIEKTLDVAKQLGFPVVLKSNPRIITQEPDENVFISQRYFNNTIPPIGEYIGQEVYGMIVYAPMNYDYQPFFKIPNLNVMPGVVTYADLTMKGVSKKSAIEFLLNYFKKDDYYAFGDSSNDIEMLKEAKEAIVMGQADQNVKQYATLVTEDIDHDGIEKACRKLKLI
ncbi:MAG: HAD family phosphatase [Erysipelotrichaceae bacterium]|nr:HAD family phosphatase [Erysipelotrichaceae bacterium]